MLIAVTLVCYSPTSSGDSNGHFKSLKSLASRASGGEGGIRTRGGCYTTHAFQACALNHSATSPARFAGRSYSGFRAQGNGRQTTVFGAKSRLLPRNGSPIGAMPPPLVDCTRVSTRGLFGIPRKR